MRVRWGCEGRGSRAPALAAVAFPLFWAWIGAFGAALHGRNEMNASPSIWMEGMHDEDVLLYMVLVTVQ